ncbi:hypothetical protein [Kineococcus sp. SYSU DK004]|uniref:hypothetical protein n=1 Tax=Kineococcus sp. SYSU DK004 TaxID=3383125 RepID=UPI003D7E7E97
MGIFTSRSAGGSSAEDAPLPAFDDGGPTDGKSVRVLLAAVAGAAVLAGGTAGFLWLSTSPAADASALDVSGARGVPSISETPTTREAFPLAGRDVFGALRPETPVAGGNGSVSGGSGSLTGTAPVVGGSSPVTVPGVTVGGTPAPSVVPTAPVTGAPGVTPSVPTIAPDPVPTPSRSTAPAWVKPLISFVEVDAETEGTGNFIVGGQRVPVSPGALVPATSTLYAPQKNLERRPMTEKEAAACRELIRGATPAVREEIKVETDDCKTIEAYVYRAMLTPRKASQGLDRSGWVVNAGKDLPAAAVGKTTGIVRCLARRGDEFLIRVDRQQAVWLEKGEEVPGTGDVTLTFVDVGLASIQRPDVAVFNDGDVDHFTVLGAGEDAGVAF